MLIVRGVNVFPSAVREVVSAFSPDVSGHILVRPAAPGVKQEPPLPVSVELARDSRADEALAEAIRADSGPYSSCRRMSSSSRGAHCGGASTSRPSSSAKEVDQWPSTR